MEGGRIGQKCVTVSKTDQVAVHGWLWGTSGGTWGDQGRSRDRQRGPSENLKTARWSQGEPKSEIGQKRSTVCTFEGVLGRVWGGKSADRTHSQAFWGVRSEKCEKPLVFEGFGKVPGGGAIQSGSGIGSKVCNCRHFFWKNVKTLGF